jgi:hypothetical protein
LLNNGKSLLAQMPVKSFGQDELRCMVNRLDKYKDNYMLFIRITMPLLRTTKPRGICVIAKPNKRFLAAFAVGKASLTTAKSVASLIPPRSAARIFYLLCLMFLIRFLLLNSNHYMLLFSRTKEKQKTSR